MSIHVWVGSGKWSCVKQTLALLSFAYVAASVLAAADPIATLEQVVEAKRDLWGEAAMQQPNGASYEFFEPLLPPPRYVHADFRYYPLVLSSPRSTVKARLISNGSGVNLNGGSDSWRPTGIPVTFRVGPDRFRFGELRDRVTLPSLLEGELPIYTIRYTHPYPVQSEGAVPLRQVPTTHEPEVYQLEAFVSTDPRLAEFGTVFVKFSLASGKRGLITIDIDADQTIRFVKGDFKTDDGALVACTDKRWTSQRGKISAKLTPEIFATVAIHTVPLPPESNFVCSVAEYEHQRELAIATWRSILDRGMQVETPEPLVNHAYRNLIIQNFGLMKGSRMHYSASNQYDQLYEAEGSDATMAMLAWGYEAEARELLEPLLDFKRAGLEYHIAGLKLYDIVRYFWQTRDAAGIHALKSKWLPECEKILTGRTASNGLFPKERYCGDISTPVYSLSVNAKAWRSLHDLAVVLPEIDEPALADRCRESAVQFHRDLSNALASSIQRETTPPFVPIALMDDEPAHDPITSVRIGSYWNLIIGYVIGSRLFPPGSVEEAWIPQYLEQHGGLCMGMTRSGGTAHAFWTGSHRVNPLYGTRYVLDTLRRDDPERALVSFYGMLAQGFTRNTFIVGEGCTLAPVDDGGRFFYCPPNSAGNGHFLTMLRNLLVQDWDLDDDGRPETLRLLYGTPRRWLEDGKEIRVDRAPTAFGPVSVKVKSELSRRRIQASITLPNRNQAEKILLRLRLPDGWTATHAQTASGVSLPVDSSGSLSLTTLSGHQEIVVAVE